MYTIHIVYACIRAIIAENFVRNMRFNTFINSLKIFIHSHIPRRWRWWRGSMWSSQLDYILLWLQMQFMRMFYRSSNTRNNIVWHWKWKLQEMWRVVFVVWLVSDLSRAVPMQLELVTTHFIIMKIKKPYNWMHNNNIRGLHEKLILEQQALQE